MFFILSLLSSFLFLTAAGDTICGEFTLSDCEGGEQIDESTEKDAVACQIQCHEAYEDDCEYYEFEAAADVSEGLCYLYRNSFKELYKSCNVIGGPRDPTVNNCTESNDACNMYVDGECEYSGKVVKDYDGRESAEDCQHLCSIKDDCKYFVYNKAQGGYCMLLETSTRTCATQRGPQKPVQTECEPTM